jgi:hypothetical protein
MNRRFAVLGLAVAMVGSVVVGLTAQQDAPVATSQTQAGPVVVRVEAVGPQLTRLHVTRNGVEQATFEAAAFTISTSTTGTVIASAGEVTMTAPARVVSVGKFQARFPTDGTTWMERRSEEGRGTTWRLYGTGPNSRLYVPPKD